MFLSFIDNPASLPPVDCKWAQWSECMTKCPAGNTNSDLFQGLRYRKHLQTARHGGKQCINESLTSTECMGYCPGKYF